MRPIRVIYCAGPGDVIGTYENWKAGKHDPRETSMTYSGQFFSVCESMGIKALVLARRAGKRRHFSDSISIEECEIPFHECSVGALFHLGQLLNAIRLLWKAITFRANVAIVMEGTHWFALSLLRLAGIQVIPDLHCTLWPAEHAPRKPVQRMVMALNGVFWASIPSATLCISPEVERQVQAIANGKAQHLIPFRPTYEISFARSMVPGDHGHRPFTLLYAGRLEANKGIFDLVTLMCLLNSRHPGQFRLTICGDGSKRTALEQSIHSEGLIDVVSLKGQLEREHYEKELAACHAVVVPTTASFVEGMNRVAVEAVLAKRPVIVTRTCPALELLGSAAIGVAPGDIHAMCAAAERLATDSSFYAEMIAACGQHGQEFYDPSSGWAAALRKAILLCFPSYVIPERQPATT